MTHPSDTERAVMEIVKQGGQVLIPGNEPVFSENAEAILRAAHWLSIPVTAASAYFVGSGLLV